MGTRPGTVKAAVMTTRRMAYWWLRFVFSGRFLATFLNLRRRGPSTSDTPPPT
jgi:hypothetical protein